MKNQKANVVLVLLGIIVLGMLLGVRTVGTGTIGVVTKFGKVTGRVLEPGLHVITPIANSVLRYSTKKVIYETTTVEKQEGSDANYKDYPVDTNTEDGQQVDVYYTIRFSVDSTKAAWIAQNIGSQGAVVEKIVKTESRIWARNVPRRFNAESLYTGKGSQEAQDEIFKALNQTFIANGLILDAVGIREIKFKDDYINAIEDKQIQAVRVETEKNKAEQAKYQKEQRITQAEGQAKEQELQRETLSSQVLQKIWLEKWNGVLPQYMLGNNQALIQLPK